MLPIILVDSRAVVHSEFNVHQSVDSYVSVLCACASILSVTKTTVKTGYRFFLKRLSYHFLGQVYKPAPLTVGNTLKTTLFILNLNQLLCLWITVGTTP